MLQRLQRLMKKRNKIRRAAKNTAVAEKTVWNKTCTAITEQTNGNLLASQRTVWGEWAWHHRSCRRGVCLLAQWLGHLALSSLQCSLYIGHYKKEAEVRSPGLPLDSANIINKAYDLHLWPTLLSLFYTLKTEQLGYNVKSLFRESCICNLL